MPDRLCRGVRALGAQMSQLTIGLPGPAPHARRNLTSEAGFPSSSSGVPRVRPGPVSAATTLWSPPRLPMRPATPTRIKSRRVYPIKPPAPWACGPVWVYLDSLDALKVARLTMQCRFEYRYSSTCSLVSFDMNWARNATRLRRNETTVGGCCAF